MKDASGAVNRPYVVCLAVWVIMSVQSCDTRMVRKLFIVESGNQRLYKSLVVALSNESDVGVFYDRRTNIQSERATRGRPPNTAGRGGAHSARRIRRRAACAADRRARQSSLAGVAPPLRSAT